MPKRKSFEDRLAQLNDTGGTESPGLVGNKAADAPLPAPQRRKLGLAPKLVLTLGAMLVVGSGAMAFVQMKGGDGLNLGLASLELPSLSDFLPGKEVNAWTYLPQMADDWITVTPDDVSRDVQASIRAVAQRYPGGEDALRAHPDFQSVGRYLDPEARPAGLLNQKSPKTQGKVLYLHPDKGAFVVEINFLKSDRALGFSEETERWQNTLADNAETGLNTGEKIQRLRFADHPAVNVAAPLMDNLMPAKIDEAANTWTQFNLRVALNYRAFLTVTGTGYPETVATLIGALDGTVLAERAERLTGTTPSLTSQAESTKPNAIEQALPAPAKL